jgi:oxygen-independent coproporphyrinogen-3 oxidase
MTTRAELPAAPGLYLHVPFCSAICPYCDFAVLRGDAAARRRFADHLIAEIALAAPTWTAPAPFDTVYFGGGTPSLLGTDDLERILAAARRRLPVTDDAWLFLEANPEDVTPEACAAWRGLGVRTLSLGVQSFGDAELRFLGRRHTGVDARRAIDLAIDAGFHTVSVDLIYGLPDQTAEGWRRNLEAAVALAPQHLSCYQLTVHTGTPFGFRAARGQLVEIAEPQQAELFELTHTFLAAAGWPAYEVSNFACSADHQSRHNRKYWDHTPYLGVGPSAHSLAGDVTTGSARRWWNERRTPRWERRVAAGERLVGGEETLGRGELALEALMLGLRTAAGIDLDRFAARYGVDLAAANVGLIGRLTAEGRLRVGESGGRWLIPTLAGLAVADGLAATFDV